MNVEGYPKDFQEFLHRFRTDDDCWEYLFSIRGLMDILALSVKTQNIISTTEN